MSNQDAIAQADQVWGSPDEAEREYLRRINTSHHEPVISLQAENDRLRDLLRQARETLARGTPDTSRVIAAIDAVFKPPLDVEKRSTFRVPETTADLAWQQAARKYGREIAEHIKAQPLPDEPMAGEDDATQV